MKTENLNICWQVNMGECCSSNSLKNNGEKPIINIIKNKENNSKLQEPQLENKEEVIEQCKNEYLNDHSDKCNYAEPVQLKNKNYENKSSQKEECLSLMMSNIKPEEKIKFPINHNIDINPFQDISNIEDNCSLDLKSEKKLLLLSNSKPSSDNER